MSKMRTCTKIFFFFFFVGLCAFASVEKIYAAGRATSSVHGYEAYRNKDWNSAIIFLRQSVNTPAEVTPEILFMLIQSEMNAKDFKNVINDCNLFLRLYPTNIYKSVVMFNKGKAAFNQEKYNDAILLFSEYCDENSSDSLYAQALFWIAESFYQLYDFDSAKDFYARVVNGYPDCNKKAESERRLEDIGHWEREEKLLYLLKVTGEEYLAAKEEYERELKLYKNSDIDGLRQKVREYSERISELEARNAELESAAFDAMSAVNNVTGKTSENKTESVVQESGAKLTENEIRALKEKALRLQAILDSSSGM